MNRAEHILTTLGEEGVEVAHRVAKALRFGLDEVQPGQELDNAQRIGEEVEDLIGMYLWAQEEGIVPPIAFRIFDGTGLAKSKRAKVERFMAISRAQGVLE